MAAPTLPDDLHPHVADQLAGLALEADRPLIATDADEVLFQFMAGLERFLEQEGLTITLDSFAITGNVRNRETGEAIERHQMKELLDHFFAEETTKLDPVPGAADALRALSDVAQVVVVSNVPLAQREDRAQALAGHGMPYPVIANIGLKGAALADLASRAGRPVFFLDDIPHNLAAVHKAVEGVNLIHFVADERLRKLVPTPDVPHARADDWDEVARLIAERIRAHQAA